MNTYKTFGINFFGFVFNITNINKDKSLSFGSGSSEIFLE